MPHYYDDGREAREQAKQRSGPVAVGCVSCSWEGLHDAGELESGDRCPRCAGALAVIARERQQTRPTLSFDGFGINGPDEYRTALAKFTSWERGQEWGQLFAAAPDLLAALKRLLGEHDALSLAAGGGDRWPEAAKAARAAIEAAGG